MDCRNCGEAISAQPVICARCGKVFCQDCAAEHDCPRKISAEPSDITGALEDVIKEGGGVVRLGAGTYGFQDTPLIREHLGGLLSIFGATGGSEDADPGTMRVEKS